VAIVAMMLLFLLFGLSLGGGSSGSSSSSGSGTAQPERALSLRDSGRTITMRRGEQATLRLPSRWVWETPHETGHAIDLSNIDSYRDTGFTEWGLAASRRGSWTFRTVGRPGSKRFHITIRVR
jgi:hypothetical protein